eukprot:10606640-Lingulodinium_polyedra.AAC.1
MAVEVRKLASRAPGETFYTLATPPGQALELHWKVLLDPEGMKVVSAQGVSPAHLFLQQGRKLRPDMGLVWRQVAAPTTPLALAARMAFKQLNQEQLKKLMGILGLPTTKTQTLLDQLEACVRHALPELSDEEVWAILEQRAAAPAGLQPDELPEE